MIELRAPRKPVIVHLSVTGAMQVKEWNSSMDRALQVLLAEHSLLAHYEEIIQL